MSIRIPGLPHAHCAASASSASASSASASSASASSASASSASASSASALSASALSASASSASACAAAVLAATTRAATVLAVTVLVGAAGAQAPSAWSVLPVPGGVSISAIQQRGKVLAYRDGNTLRAWSALTREWRSVAVSIAATVRIANDVVLIQDGTKFSAFASYTGRFASVTLGTGASVVNPGHQKNDSIMLVTDGTDLWSFSGFIGQWSKRSIGAGAIIAVQRHVAVVADGKQLHAMSAFRGQWRTTTLANAATMAAADGTVGVAASPGAVHGFSALRESWQTTTALTGTTNLSVDDDVAIWWDGVSYLGFSGLRGSFSKLVTGVAAAVETSEQLAVVRSGKSHWFYAAPTGGWTTVQLATIPAVTIQSSVALLVETDRVHAFSASRGTLATTVLKSQGQGASAAVAAVVDGSGKGALFSALLAQWTALPSGATGTLPAVCSTGALVKTATGFSAFSARTGSFHGVATNASAIPHVDPASAILAVEDGKRLLVFEPRRDVWLQQTLAGPSGIQVHIWRTNLLAFDGSRAIGFGASHGRIESVALNGTFQHINSNSESGRAVMDKSIAAFSAVPLLSTTWQYPEFRRTFAAGTNLDVHLSAAGSTGRAWLALGVQPPFALPGLGEVLLDGTQLLQLTLPFDARAGTARASIAVPDLPGLRGLEVFMQALVVPTSGRPYVTALASVLLY